jgi:hypothetical protein
MGFVEKCFDFSGIKMQEQQQRTLSTHHLHARPTDNEPAAYKVRERLCASTSRL